jgi:RecJ-like exonuclease
MSDYNYYSDSRVRAGSRGDWFKSFDEKRQVATITIIDCDTDSEEDFTVPVKMEVCPTCEGRGKHTNPSIDAGGLSREDFEEDPDFREEYMNGMYDVTCYECNGKRVVPVIDEENCDASVFKRFRDNQESDAEFRALQESERRMGC